MLEAILYVTLMGYTCSLAHLTLQSTGTILVYLAKCAPEQILSESSPFKYMSTVFFLNFLPEQIKYISSPDAQPNVNAKIRTS